MQLTLIIGHHFFQCFSFHFFLIFYFLSTAEGSHLVAFPRQSKDVSIDPLNWKTCSVSLSHVQWMLYLVLGLWLNSQRYRKWWLMCLWWLMWMQYYNIQSWNVNGINNPIKSSEKVAKLKREKMYIVFLQETHLSARTWEIYENWI